MTSYASAKGRATQTAPAATRHKTTAVLSEAEKARIGDNKAFIVEHMPEMLPMIRELHAEGLIDGWRSVKSCRVIEQ